MTRVLLIMILSSSLFCRERHDTSRNSLALNDTLLQNTSLVQVPPDPEKWAAISAADAQSLARQQGDSWKKSLKEKKILMGLGPDGLAKLRQLLGSNDPTTTGLFDQLRKTADAIVAAPMPQYTTTSQAMSKGQTAIVANNEVWMRPVADQVVLLSIAAKATDNENYKKRLHDMVMVLCDFPSWGAVPLNADLVAGHVSRAIAIAWNWQPDLWTGTDRARVIETVRTRVSTLCNAIYGGPGGYWAGMYTGNHNQVSVAGAGLAGLAFINDIPEASEWLAAAWLNFKEVVKYGYADGASAEGTAYLTGGVSFTVQFIEAVNGVLPSYTLYEAPFLKNVADYRINNTVPGYRGIMGWGDSYPLDFSGPEHFLLRFASQYNDPEARYAATHAVPGCGGGDDVKAWAWLWSLPTVKEKAPAQLDYHADVYDVVNSRSGWGGDDYVFTLKSGYNNRNHSHLDAGAFALIMGDNWLLPTPGYGKGASNQDFWDKIKGRWNFQSNLTESNSTLLINKAQQRHDFDARATVDHFSSYDQVMTTECDLTKAYDGASSVRRRVFHRRGEYIIIKDEVSLNAPGQVDWMLLTPPNGVANDNSVNIQGKEGSVNVHLLSPKAGLALFESAIEKKDLPAPRQSLSATVSGRDASFIAVIEPKINGRQQEDKEYSVLGDNGVRIKSASGEERIYFSGSPSTLADQSTRSTATARMLSVQEKQGRGSEWVVTDATTLQADGVQLSSGSAFSADLIRNTAGGFTLNVSDGKNISVKGGKVFQKNGNSKKPVSGHINQPGLFSIEP